MKKLLFTTLVIILINIYLWRNPISEEQYTRFEPNKSYDLEFSFSNKCTYRIWDNGSKNQYNNCKYSYKNSKITITYQNGSDKITEVYLLSDDHKILTLASDENITLKRINRPRIFNENH